MVWFDRLGMQVFFFGNWLIYKKENKEQNTRGIPQAIQNKQNKELSSHKEGIDYLQTIVRDRTDPHQQQDTQTTNDRQARLTNKTKG